MEKCAVFIARTNEKYGREVLAEIEEEERQAAAQKPANKKSRVNYGILKILHRSKTMYQNKTAKDVGLKKGYKSINQIQTGSEDIQRDGGTENIAIALADDNSGDLEEINKVLTVKRRKLVKLAHAKKDYNDLADEINKIREKKQRTLVAKAETEGYKKRIEELQDFINEADTELVEYDEKMVRKYIKAIRIFDDRLQVFFKAGIDIDITRE